MSNEQLVFKMKEYGITPYVFKLINLYANGASDKVVAIEMKRGLTTVNMAKTRLRDRMGCESTVQMFVKLAKEGII